MHTASIKWIIIKVSLLILIILAGCTKPPFGTDINVKVWRLDNSMGVALPDAQDLPPENDFAGHTAHLSFDLLRDIDIASFDKWSDSIINEIRGVQGCEKCRSYRDNFFMHSVNWISWWEKNEDWTTFVNGDAWAYIISTLHKRYATNITYEIWYLDHTMSLLPEDDDQHPVKPEPYIAAAFQMNLTFNLSSNVKPGDYESWSNKAITKIVDAPGCVGWCSSHNKLDSPRFEWTSWWNSMDEWAKFIASDDWSTILRELSEPHTAR